MITIGIALLVFTGILGLVLLFMQPVLASYTQKYMMRVKANPVLQKRVKQSSDEYSSGSATRSGKQSSLINLCRIIGQHAIRALPALNNLSIRQALIEANFRRCENFEILIGAKILCGGILSLAVASQFTAVGFLLALGTAYCGWILPNFSVMGRAKKRKQKLFLELPTMLDLVAVCARAGLGLMGCFDRVAKDIGGTCPIAKEELDQFLTDTTVFGRSLTQALTDMAQRCGVEELENVTSALVIASQKGADISSTLQKQSAALRDRIKRKAEEQLSTAPVKMVPVTMLFILPLILVPSLGPTTMMLMQAVQQMTHPSNGS